MKPRQGAKETYTLLHRATCWSESGECQISSYFFRYDKILGPTVSMLDMYLVFYCAPFQFFSSMASQYCH